MNKMKIGIVIFGLLLLSSCRSTHIWIEDGYKKHTVYDTICLQEIHHHYVDWRTGYPCCAWVEETCIPIEFELLEPVYKRKRVRYNARRKIPASKY